MTNSKYNWSPPKSPVGMLQEDLWPDEWKILVACLLHNLTTRKQVDKVYHNLFQKYPTPEDMACADENEISKIIQSLGMQNRRSKSLKRFSQEYLKKDWENVIELYGCGKYADDCHKIFCTGQWKEVQPSDHALNKYHVWLNMTTKEKYEK
jgi:methyl-CpG-binding domain protein 4